MKTLNEIKELMIQTLEFNDLFLCYQGIVSPLIFIKVKQNP